MHMQAGHISYMYVDVACQHFRNKKKDWGQICDSFSRIVQSSTKPLAVQGSFFLTSVAELTSIRRGLRFPDNGVRTTASVSELRKTLNNE